MQLQAQAGKKPRALKKNAPTVKKSSEGAKQKAHAPVAEIDEKRAAIMATLNNLPPDLGRNRILNAEVSAAFWGVSLPHWRRLYRSGNVPPPIKIGERKLGWRVGDLADGLAQRASE